MTKDMALYRLTAVLTGAGANCGPGRLMAILLEGGSNASSVDVFNAGSATGTARLTMSVGTALTQFYDFTNIGGIACNTGIWVEPTGTSAIAYVWVA